MTDTRFFYTVALDRKSGRARKFFSLRPYGAHKKALEWLRSL